MYRLLTPTFVVLIGLVSACSVALPSVTVTPIRPTQQPTAAMKTGTIRVAQVGSGALSTIPYLMALDMLRQQGYTVEVSDFARVDLIPAALAKGDIDVAYSSNLMVWAAIAKDAPIRTITRYLGNQYAIMTKKEITICTDLQGKSIVLGATTNVNAAMLDQYLRQNCAGTKPQLVVMASSPVRMTVLLSGQVDVALLETDDVLEIERQAPGRYRVLRLFADEFPQVEVGGMHANKSFMTQYPERIKDFLRALIQAHRQVQDKQDLCDAINRYLSNDPTALAATDTYLAQNAWDVNGGMTRERVQATLTFLIGANMLPAGFNVDQVADLSHLNAVLDEMGRK